MRLLFLGSGEFGLPTLQKLVATHDVCAVISSEDRPAGRNQKVTPTSISAWASQNDIKVLPTVDVNSTEMVGKIDALEVDESTGWLTVSTTRPTDLYEQLPVLSEQGIDIQEMHSGDDSLQGVFDSLLGIHRGEI